MSSNDNQTKNEDLPLDEEQNSDLTIAFAKYHNMMRIRQGHKPFPDFGDNKEEMVEALETYSITSNICRIFGGYSKLFTDESQTESQDASENESQDESQNESQGESQGENESESQGGTLYETHAEKQFKNFDTKTVALTLNMLRILDEYNVCLFEFADSLKIPTESKDENEGEN
jgi:hypothetical protein